jgi:hypothetical protein
MGIERSFERTEIQTQHRSREHNLSLTSAREYLMLIIALLRDPESDTTLASCK